METTLKDAIEREIIVRAPKERVYKAITDPGQLVKWFPDGVEGRLEPGERPVFDFSEYGSTSLYIVAAEAPNYFAYRWLPAGVAPGKFRGDVLSKPNTLVEFRLEDAPEGTRVKLRESGFASLPSEFYENAFKENNEGWDYMLARLQKLYDES